MNTARTIDNMQTTVRVSKKLCNTSYELFLKLMTSLQLTDLKVFICCCFFLFCFLIPEMQETQNQP